MSQSQSKKDKAHREKKNNNNHNSKDSSSNPVAIAKAVIAVINPPTPEPAQIEKFYRLPACVRRMPEFADVEQATFFNPSCHEIAEESIYAVTCRAAFTHVNAMWMNERGYVRGLLSKSQTAVFITRMGRFPILLLRHFTNTPAPQATAVGRIVCPPKNVSSPAQDGDNEREAQRFVIDVESTKDDRTLTQILGNAEKMIAAKAFCDTLVQKADPGRNGHGNVGFVKGLFSFSTRRNAQSEEAQRVLDSTFDVIRFRNKRTYIQGIECAVANLTTPEMKELQKLGLLTMPFSEICDYDTEIAKRQCTIRWKTKTSGEEMLKIAADIQGKFVGTSCNTTNYGCLRITLPNDLNRQIIGQLRGIIGKNTNIIIIPDISTPAEEKAWQGPKVTLFRPAEPLQENTKKIRRALQCTQNLPWSTIFAVLKKLDCVLLNCDDRFSHAPMSFVIEWENTAADKVAEWEKNVIVVKAASGKETELALVPIAV
jgi:hypothetical protein